MDEDYGNYHSIELRIEHAMEAIQSVDRPKVVAFAREFYVIDRLPRASRQF